MSRHVLIIDDTRTSEALATGFRTTGWTVHESATGGSASRIAAQVPLDAAVITLRLLEERGDSLFYRICSIQPRLQTRTVMLISSAKDRSIVAEAGCECVMMPREPQAIVELVTAVVRAQER